MTEKISYTHYVKCAQYVAQIGFVSTTFFGSILIYLTMFGVTRNFGSYKYLLILFPSFGIFFATLELVLYPNVYSHNAAYIFYSTHRPFNLSKDTVTWLLAFYAGVYASTVSILAVQFLYRYWAIFRTTNLRFFKGHRFFIWILYSSVLGVQYAVGLNYFERIDGYVKIYLEWWNDCCTRNITSVLLTQYTIVMYCAIRMYIEMEEKLALLSSSLRALHKKFFKTLVLQIVCPTLTLFFPVMLIIYLPLLDLEVDVPTGIFLCAFTIYPAMDAMIVMYVVKDYRKAASSLFKKWKDTLCSYFTDLDRAAIERTETPHELAVVPI